MNLSARLKTLIIISLMMVVLSACGFQLRGQYDLPVGMEKIYIQGDANGLLLRHLKQAFQRAGATVLNQPDKATAVVTLYDENMERRVLSVGDTARVREYESRYKLTYSVILKSGKAIIEKNTLSLSRDFSFNENEVLGKEREETNLQHDMQYQAAQTIMRRLVYRGKNLQ